MRIDTPRGSLIKTENGEVRLEWNPGFQPKWEERFLKAQAFVDESVIRLCGPYIPKDSGFLLQSGYLGTEIGSGTVEWIAPYSKYLYYGNLMVSPTTGSSWAKEGERKVLTTRPLNYRGGKDRGKLWFERMKADHKQEIIDGARRIAGGGQ